MDKTRRSRAQHGAERMLVTIQKHAKYMLKVDADALIEGFTTLYTSWKQAEDRIDELARQPTECRGAVQPNECRFELPDAAKGLSPFVIDTFDVRDIRLAYERESARKIIPSPLPSIPASRLVRRVA